MKVFSINRSHIKIPLLCQTRKNPLFFKQVFTLSILPHYKCDFSVNFKFVLVISNEIDN